MILGHELAHHRRWDLWLGWLQVPISMIWWFNPIYWLLVNRIRSVREDCCDDLVVASGLATSETYCETLLRAARIASGKLMAGASLAYIGEAQPLRRRFKRIMGSKLITIPRLAWTGIAIVILLALLFLPGIRKQSSLKSRETADLPLKGSSLPSRPSAAPVPQTASPVSHDETSALVISFRVLDAGTGRGIEGASLQAAVPAMPADGTFAPAGGESITDKDGRCPVPVTNANAVIVRAGGYVSRTLLLGAGRDMPDEYTFQLEKASIIGGYVRDEAGKPIRDVRMKIDVSYLQSYTMKDQGHEHANTTLTTQTDAEGRWTCSELHSEVGALQFRLTHPEHVPARYTSGVSIVPDILTTSMSDLRDTKAILVMKYGQMVSGFVRDESGNPLEGASISQIEHMQPVSTIVSGPDGRFAFAGKPGELTLRAEADGYASTVKTVRVSPRLPEIDFDLIKGRIVRGRVIDEEGNPVAGATISSRSDTPEEMLLRWQGKTDADGRFFWNAAPATPRAYRISAMGFKPSVADPPLILEPDQDHEIKLQRYQVMQVSGRVVDAATKMPLDKFTASAFRADYSALTIKSVEGLHGEFTLTLDESYSNYGITVEAAGYRPDSSRTVEFKRGDWKLEFALVRGGGPSGEVKLPGGEPVPGANVFLCGGYRVSPNPAFSQEKIPVAPIIADIKSVRTAGSTSFASTVTDQSGKFTLTPIADAFTIIATHEKGYAALTVEQFAALKTITLQPWGRVEGSVWSETKAAPQASVQLLSLIFWNIAKPPDSLVQFIARTDDEGKFVFPTVPPGEYRIIHRAADSTGEAHATTVLVRSGETTSIKLGGRGRPLIGRIVVAGADAPVDWKKEVHGTISAKLPAVKRPDTADLAGFLAWYQTEEAKSSVRSKHDYVLNIDADGTFRVEDAELGTYLVTITVSVADPSQPGGRSKPQEMTQELVISEMPGGRSDTPLDIGDLIVRIK